MLSTVTASCAVVATVDDGLSLYGYLVDSVPMPGPTQAAVSEVPLAPPQAVTHRPGTGEPRGARLEILEAVAAITRRTGRETFTIAQVVSEMRGSRYAESTVRTMVSSHLCAQAQGSGIDPYTDLERIERGVYRIRRK